MAIINRIKMETKLKEERGQGEGVNYIPWIKAHEVKGSEGTSIKTKGVKILREHHLLSRGEANYFYILEWSPNVVDIREQYPLLPLEKTVEIADSLGIKHSSVEKNPDPVMTTDFLITLANNKTIARTYKPSDILQKKTTIEKFEIERRFWLEKGIDWGIVTQNQIPINFANNIKDIRDFFFLDGRVNYPIDTINYLKNYIRKQVIEKQNTPLAEITIGIDRDQGLVAGTSLAIVKHLIAVKEITVNLMEVFSPSKPLSVLGYKESCNNYLHEVS